MGKNKPVFAGVDSTSNQKNFVEVMNMEYIIGGSYSVEKIHRIDFSGVRLYQYLVAGRVSLESGYWTWPSLATDISAQLKACDPVEDRTQTTKLAQDIVSAFSMGSFASCALYHPSPEQDKSKIGTTLHSFLGRGAGRILQARGTILRSAAGR